MSEFESPIVTIEDGQLQGTTRENFDGERFFTFLGIPYATPPVNELRFKPPQPVKPWIGLRKAIEVPNPCISRLEYSFEIGGSEDCLYLNVYTRTLSKLTQTNLTELRPVMVFIHGGGFFWGSNNPKIYGPEFLMLKDVVLVTINYRLGVLGFLSIDDTEVTGNMGLKDQVLALKWVQRNIKHFNGDPDNVTIFGQSAGSGSVHAHVLSEASKGLFHKAILQSGCILNQFFWGSKNNARQLVENLGKSVETEREALEILKQVPGLELFHAQEETSKGINPSSRRLFSAVLEIPNETSFLTKNPREVMKEGSYNQVPLMMGYNDSEGMFIEFTEKMNVVRPLFDLEDIIPYELNVSKGSAASISIKATLEDLYSSQAKDKHYEEYTDAFFLAGLIESIHHHLETSKNPIYLYRMSISTPLNRFKQLVQKLDEPGVCHGDDLGYLFHSELTPETIRPGSPEDKAIRTFVDLWTNFSEFGDPTANGCGISWPAVESVDRLELLEIAEELRVKEIPELKRVEVWRDIYKQWYNQQ